MSWWPASRSSCSIGSGNRSRRRSGSRHCSWLCEERGAPGAAGQPSRARVRAGGRDARTPPGRAMSRDAAVVAVDGGGAKTDLVLVGPDGGLLAFARGGPSQVHDLGVEGSADMLERRRRLAESPRTESRSRYWSRTPRAWSARPWGDRSSPRCRTARPCPPVRVARSHTDGRPAMACISIARRRKPIRD